jgi:hypothetical protein
VIAFEPAGFNGPDVLFDSTKSPWMTRREAADYLRCSVESIDRICVAYSDGHEEGKVRMLKIKFGVRICAADVYKLLPLPE